MSDASKSDGAESGTRQGQRYWRKNLRILAALLAVWFLVSYGCGILFADALDEIRFFGFGLGFWFAQQGAIYVFVVLIAIYVRLMNRIDDEFGADDRAGLKLDRETSTQPSGRDAANGEGGAA